MQSTSQKVTQQTAKPVINALSQYLASKAFGLDGSVRVFSMDLSMPVFMGLIGFGSEFLAEFGHSWILPYVVKNQNASQSVSMLLAPALGAAANIGLIFIADKSALDNHGYVKLGGIGAGSVVVSDYAYRTILEQYVK